MTLSQTHAQSQYNGKRKKSPLRKINTDANILPEPYNSVPFKHEGEIIGKIINIWQTWKEVNRRRKLEKTSMGEGEQIPLGPLLCKKNKLLLRNALVRSTMTYAIHKKINQKG